MFFLLCLLAIIAAKLVNSQRAFPHFNVKKELTALDESGKLLMIDRLRDAMELLDSLHLQGLTYEKRESTIFISQDEILELKTNVAFNPQKSVIIKVEPAKERKFDFVTGKCKKDDSTPFKVDCDEKRPAKTVRLSRIPVKVQRNSKANPVKVARDRRISVKGGHDTGRPQAVPPFVMKLFLTESIFKRATRCGKIKWLFGKEVYSPYPLNVHPVEKGTMTTVEQTLGDHGYILQEYVHYAMSFRDLVNREFPDGDDELVSFDTRSFRPLARMYLLAFTVMIRHLDEKRPGDFSETNIHFANTEEKTVRGLGVTDVRLLDPKKGHTVSIVRNLLLNVDPSFQGTESSESDSDSDLNEFLFSFKSEGTESDDFVPDEPLPVFSELEYDLVPGNSVRGGTATKRSFAKLLKRLKEKKKDYLKVFPRGSRHGRDESFPYYICEEHCDLKDQLAEVKILCEALLFIYGELEKDAWVLKGVPPCGEWTKEKGLLQEMHSEHLEVEAFKLPPTHPSVARRKSSRASKVSRPSSRSSLASLSSASSVSSVARSLAEEESQKKDDADLMGWLYNSGKGLYKSVPELYKSGKGLAWNALTGFLDVAGLKGFSDPPYRYQERPVRD